MLGRIGMPISQGTYAMETANVKLRQRDLACILLVVLKLESFKGDLRMMESRAELAGLLRSLHCARQSGYAGTFAGRILEEIAREPRHQV